MGPGDLVAERFELIALAGEGGMGSVFRARDHQTSVDVALKLMRHPSDDHARRFAREARALAELNHPGIVRYVNHGTAQGDAYLAMEWLEGEDLAARLARRGLTVDEAVGLVRRAADALGAAHARGVLHRDVKPSNLFLVDGDVTRVKVIDFGIARVAATLAPTATGVVMGTPGYMAPEQARGSSSLDARVDVFALGSVLFECLAGRAAFVGDHALAILTKILFDDPPLVSEVRPGVPQELDALVAQMLSKEPANRHASGADVARALEQLGKLDSSVRAPSARILAITEGEQRLISLVVAAARLDVDAHAPTVTPDQPDSTASIRAAVAAFGAHIEVLPDGSIVAAVMGRSVATDQAAAAARCALALRALRPRAPIVLASGRAVFTGRVPFGAVIDAAVRSARAESPTWEGDGIRPIVLDGCTAGLLDIRFDVRGDGDSLVLVGEREVPEATRTLLGKAVPCVGREREIEMLMGIFEQSVGEPVARVVLVKGPAGIGKSRIRYEFLRRLADRPCEVWIGRGDPMRVGSPFGMIAPAILRSAGILEGEPIDDRRRKLEARVARHVGEGDRDRVAAFLGELVGVDFPDAHSVQLRAARQDAMLMGDQTRRAWEEFVQAECSAQPLVLVLEDLHWGDQPSVHYVDVALRSLPDAPLLVLAVARPEVEQLFPGLWAERPTRSRAPSAPPG